MCALALNSCPEAAPERQSVPAALPGKLASRRKGEGRRIIRGPLFACPPLASRSRPNIFLRPFLSPALPAILHERQRLCPLVRAGSFGPRGVGLSCSVVVPVGIWVASLSRSPASGVARGRRPDPCGALPRKRVCLAAKRDAVPNSRGRERRRSPSGDPGGIAAFPAQTAHERRFLRGPAKRARQVRANARKMHAETAGTPSKKRTQKSP